MVKRFYDNGRQALIVSDSIAHLQKLMAMAEQAGVPADAMGQFTAEKQENDLGLGRREAQACEKDQKDQTEGRCA